MTPAPLYTVENCGAAYQLRWSLALFPSLPLPPSNQWLNDLKAVTVRDNVRILDHHALPNGTVQFLLSTQPAVVPPAIVKSIKGRLQTVLRPLAAVGFRRNFRLTSVGEVSVQVVENYVAQQLEHHPLASHRDPQLLERFLLTFDNVDLTEPQNSSHGQYVLALHIVLVHGSRWRTAEPAFLEKTRDAILTAAAKKQHRISRLSLLPDHVHFTLKIRYEVSPAEVALSYMNNIAFRHGMLNLWMPSYYAGTIGPYDMNTIRRNL
ncbi:MAG: transposase [Planctomycetaceae bacterium]